MSLSSSVIASYSLYYDLSIQCRYGTSCCNYRIALAHLCYIYEKNIYYVSNEISNPFSWCLSMACVHKEQLKLKWTAGIRLLKLCLTSCGWKTTGLAQLARWNINEQIKKMWTEPAAGICFGISQGTHPGRGKGEDSRVSMELRHLNCKITPEVLILIRLMTSLAKMNK